MSMSSATPDLSNHRRVARPILKFMLVAYAFLIIAAWIVLRAPGVMPAGSELSIERAAFAAVNVCTLTGFHTSVGSDDLLPAGRVAVFVFSVAAAFVVLTITTLAINRLAGLRLRDDLVILAVVGFLLFFAAAGTGTLVAGGADWREAVCTSLGALANSSAGTTLAFGVNDWRLHAVVLPLTTIGGIGAPVLLALFARTSLLRFALLACAGVYVAAVVVLLFLFWMSGTDRSFADVLLSASSCALDTRSGGWSIESISAWPRAVQGAAIVLMTVGGFGAGTAGGIGLVALALIVSGAKDVLAGKKASKRLAVALVWVGTYFLFAIVTFLLLLTTEPAAGFDRLLFLSTSAVSSVGLAHEPVSITGPGLWVLSGAMFAGRVTPLVLMVWATTMQQDTEQSDD